jgi:hypothetical protein
MLEDPGHGPDIRQARHVPDLDRLFGQERSGHLGQGRILGPAHRDLPAERLTPPDD